MTILTDIRVGFKDIVFLFNAIIFIGSVVVVWTVMGNISDFFKNATPANLIGLGVTTLIITFGMYTASVLLSYIYKVLSTKLSEANDKLRNMIIDSFDSAIKLLISDPRLLLIVPAGIVSYTVIYKLVQSPLPQPSNDEPAK